LHQQKELTATKKKARRQHKEEEFLTGKEQLIPA
jgi:hypothetical protein